MIVERAHAKVNLVLRVGPPRPGDGLHPLCSLFAALALADEVRVEPGAADEVVCPGVEGENLAAAALAAFRAAAPDGELPLLRVEIDKRIPVAAGLGGGSADAAAVLRAANELAGAPLSADELRAVGATLGSDVPSQVEPGHAIVTGVGERVAPVELPPAALVLVPRERGLSAAEVYAELDRIGGHAAELDPAPLADLAGADVAAIAAQVRNDLQPAALSLRPQLSGALAALGEAGALAAQVSGSGPTAFGLFADRTAARRAAAGLALGEGTATPIVTELRA